MNSLTVKIANKDDAPAIEKLVNKAYRGDSSRVGWTTEADFLGGQRTDAAMLSELILRPHNLILLALQNDKLVGCVHLEQTEPRVSYLGMLTVDPEIQASGIGKDLLSWAEAFSREKLSSVKMQLSVIQVRKELIAWYERRGYKNTGAIKDFPYGDRRFGIPLRDDLKMWVMEKPL